MAISDWLQQISQQVNPYMQQMGPALERGFNNPLTHAGLGIMLGSQNGGPGAAAGFMQGMQGYNQMADQQQMRSIQQAQLGRLQKQDDREEATRKAVMQMLKENPNVLPPMAQQVLQATGDPSSLQGLAAFMPKAPEAMSDYQRELIGIKKQQIENQGAMTPYQQAQVQKWKDERTSMTPYQQATVNRWDEQNKQAAEKEQRVAKAAQQKSMIAANALDAKYQGATAELDALSGKIKQFMESPGLPTLYGRSGGLLNQLGDIENDPAAQGRLATLMPEAADALALRKEIMAMGGLSRLLDLKGSGVSLGQVTEAEHKLLQQSFANLQGAQGEEAVQQRLKELLANIEQVKQRITGAYQADRALYSEGEPAQGGQEPVRVGDKAAYDRLPSGTTYIAPDGSVRVKQ